MKQSDFKFGIGIMTLIILLVIPVTHQAFFGFTDTYKLLGGFIKFFIFASIGDLISQRITQGNYAVKGLFFKALIWGFIGGMIVLVFEIFSNGVLSLQTQGLLPFAGNTFFFALFTSIFMNLIFAPTMMLFHRISDHFIEHKLSASSHKLQDSLVSLDIEKFITFVIFKTIPLFWIPAHTITFLLSETYRVLFASLLGVALGLILGFAKRKS